MVDYTADDKLPPPDTDSHAITPSVPAQQQAHAATNAPDPRDNLPAPATGSILNTSGTSISDVVRKLGIGTRDVAEGASSPFTAAGDVLTWPARAFQRAIGIPTDAPSTIVQKGIDLTGLPTAQTPTEKNISTFNKGAAAALPSVFIPGLPPAVSAATTPIRSTVGSGVGTVVGEKAAESDLVPGWAKPTVQLVGNIAGAKAADVTGNIGAKVVNAATGNVGPTTAAFDRAGVPTNLVGTVSGSDMGQSVESALSRMPFASSVVRPAQQKVVDAFGNSVERTASALDPNAVTAETTGNTVQSSYRNWKDNVFPQQQDAAWSPLNQRLAGTSVDLGGYRKALDDVTSALSLPATQKALTPGVAMQLRLALSQDVPGNVMQWGQAQQLRSLLGKVMGVPEISQSVGMDNLKRAYAGLSGDMRNTAAANGQDAVFDAANKVSTDGHAFIENVGSRIAKMNNPAQESIPPETATKNLLNSGDTTLQAVRQNLPDAADALAAYNLRTSMAAKPSVSTAYGDTSTGSFLTNTIRQQNQQPGGFGALYQDPRIAQQVDDLQTVAGRLRETEKNLNTSGTAQQLGWMAYINDILKAQGFGEHASAILKPPVVGLLGGKLMTNSGLARAVDAPGLGPATMRPGMAGLLGGLPGITQQ